METTFAVDDQAAWAALMPQLKICDPESIVAFAPFQVDAETGAALDRLIRTEGYFQLDPVQWCLPWAEMARAAATMRAAGLSPCFVFMYDEFWLAFAKLDPLIRAIMGDDYQALPAFWAWYIDPESDESGWRPHRDMTEGAIRPDGMPNAITVWLPLTDATTLNSCIHVVPADRDPGYNADTGAAAFAMGDIRALPAQAGSILCWTQGIMHWGSHSSSRAVEARISMAFEYQRGDVPPFRTPLLQPRELPSFEDRLKLICMQILFYAHMYDVPPEMTAIAHEILGVQPEG